MHMFHVFSKGLLWVRLSVKLISHIKHLSICSIKNGFELNVSSQDGHFSFSFSYATCMCSVLETSFRNFLSHKEHSSNSFNSLLGFPFPFFMPLAPSFL